MAEHTAVAERTDARVPVEKDGWEAVAGKVGSGYYRRRVVFVAPAAVDPQAESAAGWESDG